MTDECREEFEKWFLREHGFAYDGEPLWKAELHIWKSCWNTRQAALQGELARCEITDNQMYDIDANWGKSTPEQKLAWFNGMAKRPMPPMQYWREILDLANYYANIAQPVREYGKPDFVTALANAEKIVKAYPLYRKFIDGTPLENDIAVWMAEFAVKGGKP